MLMNRCPIANFYETLVHVRLPHRAYSSWRTLALQNREPERFIFPLVFVMTLVATLGNPVDAWTSPVIRNAWLDVHITLVLLGYRRAGFYRGRVAALPVPGARAEAQEAAQVLYYRLPALGTWTS
jgi:hypothetical protein